MKLVPRVSIVAFAALLSACPETKPADHDGGVDAGCAGQLTCDCRAGDVCDVGECVGGTCTDCRRGEAACICRSNGSCNSGLRCEGNTCAVCPAGEQGCACNAGACNSGLTCANGSCVPDTCVAGSQGCPCRSGAPRCDGTQYCDSSSLCQQCAADVAGCACDNGSCLGGLVCETGNCRDAKTCADLVTAGACAQNQACVEGAGSDATCTVDTCITGFYWNGVGCTACAGGDCSSIPSCGDLADGGLGADCAAQNRECIPSGQTGSCGACLQGFTQNGAGACVAVPRCGSTTCALSQYCDRTGTPTCRDLPCDGGTAMESTTMICTACGTCSGEGLSGRVWPYRSNDGACVCETLDNYFILAGAGSVQKCDSDGDGWVNEQAETVTADSALRNNSRCAIRTADRVRLFDEYGVSIDILSCGPGLLKASRPGPDGGYPNGGLPLLADGGVLPLADGDAACPAPVPLRLLETERNDTGLNANPARFPTYPYAAGDAGTGRLLIAAEVNSLTKACVSAVGDFDHDGVSDIDQKQSLAVATTPATPSSGDQARLRSFAYFIELEESYWQSSGTGNEGVLVIKERNRCNMGTADFPLRYDPLVVPPSTSDGYTFTNDKPYWRTCSRNRDADFSTNLQPPNSDFEQWSCDATSGACFPLPPPPHASRLFPQGIDTEYFRNFGLCRLNGALPADGLWRGLHHQSQFKCVATTGQPSATPPTYTSTTFIPGAVNAMTFNACTTRQCNSLTDPTCRKALGSGKQTLQPILDCTAVTAVSDNVVGFAAVNFQTQASHVYTRGCIDEGTQWGNDLCPYPQFSASDGGDLGNFGRYSCYGKGTNFLWAPSDGGYRAASTLVWSTDAGASVNGSTWSPE